MRYFYVCASILYNTLPSVKIFQEINNYTPSVTSFLEINNLSWLAL